MKAAIILDDLLKLQAAYQKIFRVDVTADRYERHGGKDVSILDEAIREPLIEHIGHLPIITAFLHQHLTNSAKVELGHTLAILAVHDIGETVLGDIFTFQKVDSNTDDELAAAKKILPTAQFALVEEYEAQQSLEAKFAKCLDKIAPKLHHIAHPETAKALFEHYQFNADLIETKQLALFDWDANLQEFFKEIVVRLRQLEN